MRIVSSPYCPLLTLVAFACFQCVEPYDAPSIDYQKVVVVDGLLTDEATAHTVRLSYTYPIDTNLNYPITDAEVWITEGDDTRVNLDHIGGGAYVTDGSYRATAGESYQLHFNINDQEYRSDAETLIPSPPIDSIYDRYAEFPNDEINRNEPGIQFFVDTHDDTDKAKWFRYEWSDTYQLIPDFPSLEDFEVEIVEEQIVVVGNDTITIPPDTIVHTFDRTEENKVFPCYESRNSVGLIIGNTVGASVNRLREMPVNFVSGLTPILKRRYSITVTQYAITDEAYNYYRKVNESIENTGSLFDKQQGTIAGNVQLVETPDETVLGYFEVAGVAKSTAFFKFRDLDTRLEVPRNFYNCTQYNDVLILGSSSDTLNLELYAYVAPHLDTNDPINIPYYIVVDLVEEGGSVVVAPVKCTSCRWLASTKTPESWPEAFLE